LFDVDDSPEGIVFLQRQSVKWSRMSHV